MKKTNSLLLTLIAAFALCALIPSGSAFAMNPGANALQVQTNPGPGAAPMAKTFSGTVSMDQQSGEYILKSGKKTYKLDDQDQAKQFDGKKVTVTGTLDASTNTIHVEKIEAQPA